MIVNFLCIIFDSVRFYIYVLWGLVLIYCGFTCCNFMFNGTLSDVVFLSDLLLNKYIQNRFLTR